MNLMKLLPPIYENNRTMDLLQGNISIEMSTFHEKITNTIDNCLVDSVSELLSRYEKIYGIPVDTSIPDEFRRERIKAKMRGIGTTTKQMIKETAKAYSNGEVEVIEDSANSRFTIKFVGTIGIPQNMAGLTATIEEIKPAHLGYTFEFVYYQHTQLSTYTHEYMSDYTHNELRMGVIS